LFLRAVAKLVCEGLHDSRDNVERKIEGAVGSGTVPSTLASYGKIVHAQAKQAIQQVRGTPVCGSAYFNVRSKTIVARIESLHGTTPAEIFESGLENVNEIVGVAATILWKDGRITAGWSNLDPASLSRMILLLDEKQRRDTIADSDLDA